MSKPLTLIWSGLSQRQLDKKCTQHEGAGKRKHGQPTKTWQQCINCGLKSLKLSKDLTSIRNAWREALRMAKIPTHKKCGK